MFFKKKVIPAERIPEVTNPATGLTMKAVDSPSCGARDSPLPSTYDQSYEQTKNTH